MPTPTDKPGSADATVEIVVNDQPRRVPAGSTVADLLVAMQVEVLRVAVERNRKVVRRALHATTCLEAGDRIEIVGFVGGG